MSVATEAIIPGGRRRKVVRGAVLAVALLYVLVLLVAPIAGIVWTMIDAGWTTVRETFAQPDVKHAFSLTGVITVVTVGVTAFFGTITAWVLTRDRFAGKGFLNALVDLPMAVSPVIVGIMAVILFGRGGWFEPFFAARGVAIVFALPSMVIVTIFISIPFVIRELVPVLNEIGTDEEEAAKTLGASSLQTFFRVTLPNVKWGLLYGVGLSTARALGEIGAVLIVSGAVQGQTETATLYIFRAMEERQEPSAFAVAMTLAAISILLLIAIEIFKRKREKETGR